MSLLQRAVSNLAGRPVVFRAFSSQVRNAAGSAPCPGTVPNVKSNNVPPRRSSRCVDNFLSGDAVMFLEDMLASWKSNPESVHSSWQAYFLSIEGGKSSAEAFADALSAGWDQYLKAGADRSPQDVKELAKIVHMVRSFQSRGHLNAEFEPLGLPKLLPFMSHNRFRELQRPDNNLNIQNFGLSEEDLSKTVNLNLPNCVGYLGQWKPDESERLSEHASFLTTLPPDEEKLKPMTVGSLLHRLQETYCGSIGIEYMHITDTEKCNFIRTMFETPTKYSFSNEMKLKILHRTIKAVLFETFAAQKFATMKRFGLDGCESMIVGMKSLTKLSTLLGVDSIVIGMAHRGRLNMLHNIMNKPAYQVFSEFQGNTAFGGYDWGNLGDVKYHMGVEYEYVDPDTHKHMLISVLPNPSHLEAVNPVVLGTARARQTFKNDKERRKVVPVLIHGDASIAGQGVMYETLQMTDVPAYQVGGTIHIVVNNQIGFTTNISDAGSGTYCTDLAKAIGAPILHVNADDPEAVSYCMEVAVRYRQKFQSDIFVDIVGYRRFGHNELDMPKFTQPKMYSLVAKHPNVLALYSKRLIGEGILTEQEFQTECSKVLADYEAAFKKGKTYKPSKTLRPFSPQWHDMAAPDQVCAPRLTGLPEEALRDIGKAVSTIPPNVEPHPTVARIYKARMDACEGHENIDFGLAEALAFGSLLRDGYPIRLAGQDAQRGTFSHRHAAIHDQRTGRKHFPLVEFAKQRHYPHSIEIHNSILSEYACMGFEYGWSLENPHALNIWEAQFGDFANGGQVIIDQFLASGEVKWRHPSGLVLLLPHGFDGQGPEHSSGRIERFLSLCDDREDVIHPENWNVATRSVIQKHNLQIVNCSTAANYFHVLRRQMHRGFRKPLVVFSPKRLLRMRDSMSPLRDFLDGTRFFRYITDPAFDPITGESSRGPLRSRDGVKRLVLCSGQIYYDLVKARAQEKLDDSIMISRVEQLSPFPLDSVADELRSLRNVQSLVWAQEEPMNQGAWPYVGKRLDAVLQHCNKPNHINRPIYAGRDVSASPAIGDARLHVEELAHLTRDALDLTRIQNSYFEKYL